MIAKETVAPDISRARGLVGKFCGLDTVLVFVCVQTPLRRGLVFVLLVACCLCSGKCLRSTGDHCSPTGVPSQLWLSGAVCVLQGRD